MPTCNPGCFSDFDDALNRLSFSYDFDKTSAKNVHRMCEMENNIMYGCGGSAADKGECIKLKLHEHIPQFRNHNTYEKIMENLPDNCDYYHIDDAAFSDIDSEELQELEDEFASLMGDLGL